MERSKLVELVERALKSANACLIENGEGPTALTEAAIRHLADPLLDDLLIVGFRKPEYVEIG